MPCSPSLQAAANAAVASAVFDRLPRLFFRKSDGPASAGPPVSLSSDQLANRPASVRVANTTAPGCYHDRWDDRHAWRHHSAAVVHTGVVAVATAASIWPSVKAGSTSTSDRNCQASLCLFERRERHGLGSGKGEEADADGDSDSEKLRHT